MTDEFFENMFAEVSNQRPPVPFLQLLQRYAADADVFAVASPNAGYEAVWIAGDAVGTLSVAGADEDSPVTGAVCAIAGLGPVKLGAKFKPHPFRVVVTPSILLTFSEDVEVEVGSGHYNYEEFISKLLERMRHTAS